METHENPLPFMGEMVRNGLAARDKFWENGLRSTDQLLKFIFLFYASVPVYLLEGPIREIKKKMDERRVKRL